ncbi:MAG TPA: FAD-dependent oxidoreductase [Chloroflexota bacterium]|nr:FAD-dependent oxidoreductase [Chloroflexota bacterium]
MNIRAFNTSSKRQTPDTDTEQRDMTPVAGSHAIVIGGSMAGLLAARVLADHVDRVTILERDRLPSTPATRAGVPQGRHGHLLLLRGLQIMEGLFPGLETELAAAGAVPLDWVDDMQWFNFAGPKLRFPSDLRSHVCSRELLELTVRQRVAAHPSITILDGCQVTGLRADETGQRVIGVTAHRRDGGAEHDQDLALEADLVVDAGGRSSRAPQWLEELGYKAPRETTIDAHLGYASRIYRKPAGAGAWKALYVQRTLAEDTRGGLILPLEDGRWMVTLVGVGGDYPPTEAAAFLDFARTLRNPVLYEAIKDAEPLSPIHGFRGTDNRRRHFETLARRPEGFVVVGDAFCAFNPVYGQGMTTAALGAMTLDRCLRERRRLHPDRGPDGFAAHFQQQLARVVATPWSLSTAQDLRLPRTEGGRTSLIGRLLHHYVDGATLLAAERPDAHLALSRVLHLLAPPTALFHPRIALPVLVRALSRHRKTPGDMAERPVQTEQKAA